MSGRSYPKNDFIFAVTTIENIPIEISHDFNDFMKFGPKFEDGDSIFQVRYFLTRWKVMQTYNLQNLKPEP